MKCKYPSCKPGPRDAQSSSHPHEKQCAGPVEQNIEQMVAECRLPPEPVFHPENAVNQWIVLFRAALVFPDLPQATYRTKRRGSHIHIVIPERLAAPCRPVGEERGGEQQPCP